MKEADIQRQIQKALKATYGRHLWVVKIHGSGYTQPGVPDLLGCLNGQFFALEVKHPLRQHRVTAAQRQTLAAIDEAGGTAAVVISADQALQVLNGRRLFTG